MKSIRVKQHVRSADTDQTLRQDLRSALLEAVRELTPAGARRTFRGRLEKEANVRRLIYETNAALMDVARQHTLDKKLQLYEGAAAYSKKAGELLLVSKRPMEERNELLELVNTLNKFANERGDAVSMQILNEFVQHSSRPITEEEIVAHKNNLIGIEEPELRAFYEDRVQEKWVKTLANIMIGVFGTAVGAAVVAAGDLSSFYVHILDPIGAAIAVGSTTEFIVVKAKTEFGKMRSAIHAINYSFGGKKGAVMIIGKEEVGDMDIK